MSTKQKKKLFELVKFSDRETLVKVLGQSTLLGIELQEVENQGTFLILSDEIEANILHLTKILEASIEKNKE